MHADMGSRFDAYLHPEGADQDSTSNIIFLHQMSPAQAELDAAVRDRCTSDPVLAEANAKFRKSLKTGAGGTPHFGIRYRSMGAIDQVIDRLQNGLSEALKPRVEFTEMPPYPTRPGIPNIRQVFVYTDVITTSAMGYGQLIELQVERPSSE